jgi:hypothetical protein
MRIKPKCELHNVPLEGRLIVVPNTEVEVEPTMDAVPEGWTLDLSFMMCPHLQPENGCNQIWSYGIEDM